MNSCQRCQSPIPEDNIFCPKCGHYSDKKFNVQPIVLNHDADFKTLQAINCEPLPKKRHPIIAMLSSLFIPGLGQIYNGQFLKAIGFFMFLIVITFLFSFTKLQYQFFGFKLYIFSFILLYIIMAIDSLVSAIKKKAVIHKLYNRWYFLIIFVAFFVVIDCSMIPLCKRILNIETSRITGMSESPVLLSGDYVVIDLRYDGRQYIPQKGDEIIFRNPDDPNKMMVKHVAAVENELVEITNKTLYINGLRIDGPNEQHSEDSMVLTGNNIKDDFGPYTVPKNHLFVLGNNLEKSYDSRHFGSISVDSIRGKVLYIFWSWDENNKPRYDRIGHMIQ